CRRFFPTRPRPEISGLPAQPGRGEDPNTSRAKTGGLRAGSYSSQLQRLQILAERLSQVVPVQRKLNRRLQKSKLVSGIVALPFKLVPVNRAIAKRVFQCVGQ